MASETWKYQLGTQPCSYESGVEPTIPIEEECPACGEALLLVDDRVIAHATCLGCGARFCVRRYT